MLGKIIRVGGVFKANGLPKLEDHDTSDLMNAILSNDAVAAFYDFTDESTIEFDGDKVVKIKDKKSGQQFKQIDLALAPKYNRSIFNGVGGLYFDGTSEMSAENFYNGSESGAVSLFVFPTALPSPPPNAMILSMKSAASYAIYHNLARFVAFNGKVAGDTTSLLGHNHIVTAWSNGGISMMVNNKIGSSGVQQAPGIQSVYIGRWNDTSAPNYFKGYLGHVILFSKDMIKDEYLNQLIAEYCKRRYKHYA